MFIYCALIICRLFLSQVYFFVIQYNMYYFLGNTKKISYRNNEHISSLKRTENKHNNRTDEFAVLPSDLKHFINETIESKVINGANIFSKGFLVSDVKKLNNFISFLDNTQEEILLSKRKFHNDKLLVLQELHDHLRLDLCKYD